MPEYVLSVWHDEEYSSELDFDDPDLQRQFQQVSAVNEELQKAGAWVYGNGLRPTSSATVVRADGGTVSMTDGPYAESKEQMGGFWIIQAPDLDAALEWARKCTIACERPIEVRPTEGA